MSHNKQSGPQGMTFKNAGKKGATANKQSGVERNRPHGKAKDGGRTLRSKPVKGVKSKG